MAATTKGSTLSTMINEYVTMELLQEEFKGGEDWLLKNTTMDKTWVGGKYIVPFQVSVPSSVRMGALTDEADIDYATYARGYLDTYKECFGSLLFHQRDLFDHGRISEQNFVKLLPDQLDQLMANMRQTVSIQVLGGRHIDTLATATDIATDVVYVNHPERFTVGQKLTITDGTTSASGYVKTINKNTGLISFVTARGGSTAVDLAGIVEADAKVYIDGGYDTYFSSLKDQLLPAANGGSDSFANTTKTDSTYAQSVLYDAGGSGGTGDWGTSTAITKSDILNMLFGALMKFRQRGAKPTVALMSYKHYHAALKLLEAGSGAYKNIKPSVSFANYSEMEIGGIAGSIKLVGIREMEDDWIPFIDPKYLLLVTGKNPFEVMKSPDGLSYFTKRATTGYSYITDLRFVGEFLYKAPWTAGVVYNLPTYSFN